MTDKPHAPTSLTAEANGSTNVDLSWNAPARTGGLPITGYRIERSSNEGSTWTDVQTNTGNADTTLQDAGLNIATTYHYRVSARNSLDNAGVTTVGEPIDYETTPSYTTTVTIRELGPP